MHWPEDVIAAEQAINEFSEQEMIQATPESELHNFAAQINTPFKFKKEKRAENLYHIKIYK